MQGETMFRVAIFNHQAELNDTFLAQMAALGAQAIDFVRDTDMPGVKEHGLPDLDEVKALRRRLRSFGLEINRVTLPDLTETFMNGGEGAEAELKRTSLLRCVSMPKPGFRWRGNGWRAMCSHR